MATGAGEGEAEKLKRHLDLLRQEYVKLQNKLADLEKKYSISSAAAGNIEEDNFVSKLLRTVADLFDRELYSDLTIKLDGATELKGHKFVLAARSDNWGVPDLAKVNTLDFTGFSSEIGQKLLKWVYTDQVELPPDNQFLLQLMSAASKFKLDGLRDRCEKALMSSVTVRNAIQFYATAEEIGATTLRDYCSEIISSHWNDFTSDDFVSMSAPLLYKMLKAKTEFPLHASIKIKREDVVFLYLVEYDSQLPGKLNLMDDQGDLPLDLALSSRQDSTAAELVKHRVDVNAANAQGKCLLHRAIQRGDEFSASFLIRNGARVNVATSREKETALHQVASFTGGPAQLEGMGRTAQLLLDSGADPNMQDADGNTALHRAVIARNRLVFALLLGHKQLNLELRNRDSSVVLWLALDNTYESGGQAGNYEDQDSLAGRLVGCGASPDAVNSNTGNSLLHLATEQGNEEAAIFLVNHGAKLNHANNQNETVLHVAARKNLSRVTGLMLAKGANPNLQSKSVGSGEGGEASQQTPLHLAMVHRHPDVVSVYLEHRAAAAHAGVGGQTPPVVIIPDLNLKDSQDQTVLGVALWAGLHDTAAQLLGLGANINAPTAEGLTLLHQAILRQDTNSAIFLLEHQADVSIGTREKETPLQLAIRRHLPVVVDALCVRGAAMNQPDGEGNVPLWVALETGQEDVASTLVRHGCDVNAWGPGPDNSQQTLLHRAIDENNEAVASFLVRSGCDVNSPRKAGLGEGFKGGDDGHGPLHMACQWGLELVVQTLVEHRADVNAKDSEGQSPIHIAIANQHEVIISLLLAHPLLDLTLRDRSGATPFAAAMISKNNKAAQAILNRESGAAEQLDNKGRNFLHTAVMNSDIESVLFLISVHANVNSRVQDSARLTPLHLAVKAGSEIIVRNLLLAGASVNELTSQKQTALHLAALHDQPAIATVLLENGVDFDAPDNASNNALHLAVMHGHLNVVRTLLSESAINAEAVNHKGQSPMHVLGHFGKDNAAAIFDLFKECMPEYPVDKPDADGNTVLLLAYQKGNGNLCRSIVRSGACLGTINKQGVSLFSAQVATRQLLFRLLDMLSSEPPWSESEVCQECQTKFGIKTRKHHCRHCGRIVCAKCSTKMMPIIKYDLNKPVRVCDVCFDVLTLGSSP